MKNSNIKTLIPVIAAIAIFIAVTYGYFSPLLKGKVMVQSDMVQYQGMVKEINDFKAKYHEEPLWTNSMFGGMPAYQISAGNNGNLIPIVRSVLTLGMPSPASIVFNYLLGFFILMLVLRINPWLGIVGAIAFAFSAYNFIIIDAGHLTKALAIGYMAPVFAGAILICRQKYLLGGAVTALFMALEFYSNHFQITYYFILFLSVYIIIEFIQFIRDKQYKALLKAVATFAFAFLMAFSCNISNLWNTYKYAKLTMRGGSELTDNATNKTSGLDKDYATMWSLGKAETMTLMIPSFKGSSSSIRMSESKTALKDVDPAMRESIANVPQYWGDQPFTISPYSGAIIIFLFVLGLFIVEGRIKWALLTTTIIAILLSWGKNFMGLTDFFLEHFPMYNKFRAVSSILIIAEFAIPILAIMAIDKLISNTEFFKQKIKLAFSKKEITVQNAFFISFGLTGGLSLLFYLMPDLTSFVADSDDSIFSQVSKSNGADIAQKFLDNIEIARKSLFKADSIRSFFFILLAAGAIWLFVKSKINNLALITLLGLFVLVDLWTVNRRYLQDDSFVNKKEAGTPFKMSAADAKVLEDSTLDYRVLNIAANTFNESGTSYFHKSIGGYHAAKLRRYQDLIDFHIGNNIQNIKTTLQSNPNDSSLRATFARQTILNMLNTKYIIYNPEAAPLQNRYALGNAWFVTEVKSVKNPDEEIKAVGEINPAKTAIVDERYLNELEGFVYKPDASARIMLKDYLPNHLTYESNTSTEQLSVFSEIYYKDGWNAYVDGELKPHFGVDYVLRAMRVPSGKHTIEFKYEPASYHMLGKISLTSCLLLFGFLGGALFISFKKME